MAERKKGGLKWDEDNIRKNDEESLAANRTKILEPKTPYHELLDDGETPAAFPPKAPAARAGPRLHDGAPSTPPQPSQQLAPGMDFAALAAAAEERRQDAPEDDEVERNRKFAESRKNHYKIGSLAALRAQAAAMDEEDDDEDE